MTLGACGTVGTGCWAPMRSKCKQEIWGCILYETVYRIAIRCSMLPLVILTKAKIGRSGYVLFHPTTVAHSQRQTSKLAPPAKGKTLGASSGSISRSLRVSTSPGPSWEHVTKSEANALEAVLGYLLGSHSTTTWSTSVSSSNHRELYQRC